MAVTLDNWLKSDRRNYRIKQKKIQAALEGSTGFISGVTEQNKEDIFYMLMFCLCVPQSKALKAEDAIDRLRSKNFYLYDIPRLKVVEVLKSRVRFHSTKTDRLLTAKQVFFKDGPAPVITVAVSGGKGLPTDMSFWVTLKYHYRQYKQIDDDAKRLQYLGIVRIWLIKQINGMGMKLASHFLRNIGMPGLAILDVHIIKGMQKRGLITEADVKPLTSIRYRGISQVMREYAGKVGVSIDELDLLFWSQQTGYVFK